MSSLQNLRNAHRLTRLVLVWLALFIGVAVATPLLQSASTQLVCSALGGTKLVQLDADDTASLVTVHASLDCPACLPLIAPPAARAATGLPLAGPAHTLLSQPSVRLTRLPSQPWQARAPPVSFA